MICNICPHNCDLSIGSKCGIIVDIDGASKIKSNYKGLLSTLAIDQIEKRPFFHFAPGSKFTSVGMYGCNFHCGACLNFEISQNIKNANFESYYDAKSIVNFAKINETQGIVFSYNEPTIHYEYLREVGHEAIDDDLLMAIKTNGFISLSPLRELTFLYDAFNVDLKGDEETYDKYCGGSLEHVKKSIELIVSNGNWLEISYLILPNMINNDLWNEEAAKWISSLNNNIPVHLLYFYSEKENANKSEIYRVKDIFVKYLKYVYISNLYDDDFISFRNTCCRKCGKTMVLRNKGTKVNCLQCCGEKIAGLFV